MPVKDPFSYSARWDSIGLDCSNCRSFRGPLQWPDKNRVSRCERHDLSLAVELQENGYKLGEWFCRDFEDNGRAANKALAEFQSVQSELQPRVLYGGYVPSGVLKEILFAEISRQS